MAEPDFSRSKCPWGEQDEARDGRLAKRVDRLNWSGAIGLAVVAFGLLADPSLSTSLGCIMFGCDEFRLAHWLKRTDPARDRGRTCSRFYLAWGLWRITLVAALMIFIIGIADTVIEGRPAKAEGSAPLSPGIMGCLVTMLVGFLLSSAVSIFAVISALRHRVRVWVGPEARQARSQEAWPPRSAYRREPSRNRAKIILLSTLIVTSVPSFLLVFSALSYVAPHESTSLVMIVVTLIGVPLLILVLQEKLGGRMIASTPEACWTDDVGNDRRRI